MDKMKFDETAVNTNLANEYLKNNSIFKSKGFKDSEETAYNGFKNTIRYSDYKRTSGIVVLCDDISEVPRKLYSLAKKIEENVYLFCQLELLIRKIPIEDTKNIDLELIIQNLIYYSSPRRPEVAKTTVRQIVVCRDSPLLVLGCVAQALIARMPRVVIECTKETAPVCSLFTELCHEVGFKEKVLLAILPRIPDDNLFKVTMDLKNIKDFLEGGVGIVTGKCDVDSAVDTFIAASLRYPWTLKKIYVQESVLERFKRALAWKAEKPAPGSHEAGVEASCSASYRCGDKVFAVDATGEVGARVVALEAYRTVRELLTLLEALRPLAASVWSSDVAESLELAHGLGAAVVWVNDFADFRGPPRVSQAFYSVVDLHLSTRTVECVSELAAVERLQRSWLRRGAEEREDSLMRRCERYSFYEKIVDFQDSFMRATEDSVVTGTVSPALIWRIDFANTPVDMSAITFLIKGGGLLVKSLDADLKPLFQEILKIENVPIVHESDSAKRTDNRSAKVIWRPCYKHKVIWNNYGTIFAN